ncbi:class A sortase [Listeria fleischmannii]|uniref:Sortase family protein n=1 Tax=Listeria fleischmannii FSL S10-1203 TaxID=1265822 RepID=W7DGB7_9LIST|nr:class A sortase [Listeria fleischmannii]EUJ48672.1 sortase family protein [Listeria fleischmannii FSL S10-1203]
MKDYHSAKVDTQKVAEKVALPITFHPDTQKTAYKATEKVDRPSMKELSAYKDSKAYKQTVQMAIGKITIPKLNLELPILAGTTNNHLKTGVTTYRFNQINGKGNYVLLGHNMGQKHVLFSDLGQLRLGDKIKVQTADATKVYTVTRKQIVPEKQGEVLQNTTDNRLTLVTCDKGTATSNRLVVTAE